MDNCKSEQPAYNQPMTVGTEVTESRIQSVIREVEQQRSQIASITGRLREITREVERLIAGL